MYGECIPYSIEDGHFSKNKNITLITPLRNDRSRIWIDMWLAPNFRSSRAPENLEEMMI